MSNYDITLNFRIWILYVGNCFTQYTNTVGKIIKVQWIIVRNIYITFFFRIIIFALYLNLLFRNKGWCYSLQKWCFTKNCFSLFPLLTYIIRRITFLFPFLSTWLDAESSALPTVHLEAAQDGSARSRFHCPRSPGHFHMLTSQWHVLSGHAHMRHFQRRTLAHWCQPLGH